jgi:hypothetical protein
MTCTSTIFSLQGFPLSAAPVAGVPFTALSPLILPLSVPVPSLPSVYTKSAMLPAVFLHQVCHALHLEEITVKSCCAWPSPGPS